MKLSVILITHNSREMTLANARRAAEALAEAGLGTGEGELLVVDTGSSDARAANLGAKAATGDTLLFLNSDAELTAEALKALRGTFMAHPRAGASPPAPTLPGGRFPP